MQTLIQIESLAIESFIGVYEKEKKERQLLFFEITLSVKAPTEDQLEETVDYDQVVACTRHIVQAKHFHLVESMARELLEVFFKKFPIFGAKVKIKKKIDSFVASVTMQRGEI